MHEVMSWPQMWAAGRYFELATDLQPIRWPPNKDKRLVEESVVCCTTDAEHWAAIAYQGAYTGFNERLWYSTLTSTAQKRLKLRSYGYWSEMMREAQNIHIVTAWDPLLPWPNATRRGWQN